MERRERVIRAIEFDNPDRVPLWLLNKDQEEGDILWYDFRIQTGEHIASYHGGDVSEWGFKWKRLDDGTMGQTKEPSIKTWKDLDDYKLPELNPKQRLKDLSEFEKRSEGYFKLANPIITGMEIYRSLRGFENTMIDLVERNENFKYLLDRIFCFEKELMSLAAEAGFDGFYFGDDWGTQKELMISPQMWKDIFKNRYKDQFDHARSLGLYTIFHSCGNITDIVFELYDIGLDIMYISQPKVVDIVKISKMLRGKQCFMSLIDYQEVSIPGTPSEVISEGNKLVEMLGTENGGFIGYIEDYSCMGMSNENFQACKKAFLN